MPLEMEAGETVSGYIELENTGAQPWDSQTRLGTTEPRDRTSVFADESWVAPNRPAAVVGTVPPGETYRFEFNLRAPDEPGQYSEFFGLVQEGTAWFSDPAHQGPPDDQLQIAVNVVERNDMNEPDPTIDDADDPDPITDEEPTVEDPVLTGGSVPPLVGESPGVEGGCTQAGRSSNGGWLALVGVAFVWLRRRLG